MPPYTPLVPSDWIGPTAASHLLDVSIWSLARWVRKGTPPLRTRRAASGALELWADDIRDLARAGAAAQRQAATMPETEVGS